MATEQQNAANGPLVSSPTLVRLTELYGGWSQCCGVNVADAPVCKGQELASPSQRGDTANVPGVSRNVHARASVCT